MSNDVENLVDRHGLLALNNGGEGFTRNELHHEVGRAFFLAIVIDVGNTFVVDQGSVTGFSTETLEEARVTQVLVLQDLDRNKATNDKVSGLPDLTHAANSDA